MYRIGINGTILGFGRSDGFARVTYETIVHLLQHSPDMTIYSTMTEFVHCPNTTKVPAILARSNFAGNMAKLLWHQTALPYLIKKKKIDIYYSPIPDGMLWPVCPQITTIYDLSPLIYPESSPRYKHYYRFIIPRLLKCSHLTIAGSHSTKRDLESLFPDVGRIEVIYPGYSREIFMPQVKPKIEAAKNKYGLKSYILCVSEIRPYKNIRKLIEAFVALPKTDVTLAIVGRVTKLEKDIAQFVKENKQSNNIRLLGYVPDDDLASLYAGAYAFIHPSLYEGFGLPPLEAMASGCPVLVSNVSSLPEICGDAGLYFNPRDVNSISGAIINILNNKAFRLNLIVKGLERSKQFSFEKTADRLMEVFEDLHAQPSKKR